MSAPPPPFRSAFSHDARAAESARVRERHPDRVPCIVERGAREQSLALIDRRKYLIPRDLTMGQFAYVIRRRIKLSAEHALFLMVGDRLMPSSALVASVYDECQHSDGFLYVTYSSENTFGASATTRT